MNGTTPTRAEAIQETMQSSRTLWPDEQSDVPSIKTADRARYQKWIESSDLIAASDPVMWDAIKTNWIAFLSATGDKPSVVLAPCRKLVTWGPGGSESSHAAKKRFKDDRRTRYCIQPAIWLEFDMRQALAERWPVPIRTIVNKAGLGSEQGPFESWAARVHLTKRRRGDSVLAGLVCFLVYCHEEETFDEMGLSPSEDIVHDLFDVREAIAFHGQFSQNNNRDPGPVEEAIRFLVRRLMTDPTATCHTNPLLWWIGILVQSSLSPGTDDFLSRGRFPLNILTMDMDIQERVEAVLHYCKVFVLDDSMSTWEPPIEQYLDEVQTSMAAMDMEWLNAESNQRPPATADRRTCQSAAWKDVTRHVRKQSKAFLGDQPTTVGGQLRVLLQQE